MGLICFIWLLARDRILTWDHLQHKGFQGPGRCSLCKMSIEDIPHLFLTCPFSVAVFAHYAAKFRFTWPKNSTVSSLVIHWYNSPLRSASFRFLPLFIFWGIWLLRNQCLFEDKIPVFHALISRIDHFLITYPAPVKIQKIREIGPKPGWVFPCGFLDGASAGNIGGLGFMIYLNDSHYFSFSMGCGRSTNTRAELLALLATLRVCLLMGLPIKLIYGDSSVIISWLNGFTTPDVPTLMHWCGDIKNASFCPACDLQAHLSWV